MMNGHGKSDRPVVPAKSPNNGNAPPRDTRQVATIPAEGVEGRGLAKGNPPQQNRSRTPCRAKETDMANPKRARSGKLRKPPRECAYLRSGGLPSALERIRQAARRDGKMRFTALLHHVYNPDTLREAYFSLTRDAAPGVDGQTWKAYGEALE